MTSTRLTIDLGALAHNYAVLREQADGAAVAPVVKADGYGLGAGAVAKRLIAEGASSFFVARLSEGLALRRELGRQEAEIFVLDGLKDDPKSYTRRDLIPVLNSLAELEAWRDRARGAPAALHFDTGMNRLGLSAEEAPAAAQIIDKARSFNLRLVMSHLSFATSPGHPRNAAQLARFQSAVEHFPEAPASLSASAGIFLGEDYRFDMVRPGISLFGGGPEERPDSRLRPVAILEAPILQIRTIRAGESVGYGPMFTAERDMRIGLVAAGYADGLIRTSFASGKAAVGGEATSLLAVTMDLIAVDLSQIAASAGDMVELLGSAVLLDDAAAAAGTVAHECLVRLSSRAERIYRD